ncbi:MAG: cupin domain-containing protein [Gammaproteobacteria bacterium]|nr:cupin domain-containing protein [Gammaproteobacteria bacterium]MDH3412405.1 cupin domain-containing protein [Gammaproteobacteria bacterium]
MSKSQPEKKPNTGAEVVTVRPEADGRLPQNLPFFAGVSRQTAGSRGISMYKVVIPPGAAAEPHRHVKFETAIYVLKGKVETRYGPGLKKSVINQAGDFIFIPPDLPHQPVNLSDTEAAEAIVARNDAIESETVEPYDPKSE